MAFDHDLPEAAAWTTDQVTSLADAAARLHQLALPLLMEALRQPALTQTVRDLPRETPLRDLARAIAENALRRALRAQSTAPTGAESAHGVAGWQFVRNLALAELTDDAVRDLRGLERRHASSRWDG
jgi:aminopeptidase N